MYPQDFIIFNASATHWVTNCSPNRTNLCFLFKRVNNIELGVVWRGNKLKFDFIIIILIFYIKKIYIYKKI